MKSKVVIFTLVALALYSCKNGNIENNIKQLMSCPIELTSNLKYISNIYDTTTMTPESNEAYARMIIYFDSTGCGSCKISRLYEWESFVKLSKQSNDNFKRFFIFSPSKQNKDELLLSLRGNNLKHPMIFDEDNLFSEKNKHIPQNELLHTFLIDKNNNVVIVGNPINNETLYKLYIKTIQELIANKGIMKN